MFTPLSCRIKLLVFVVLLAASAYAQWATPAIDGSIAVGDMVSNNQLNNAGNTER